MGVLSQVAGWLRGDQRAPRHVLGDLISAYRDEVQASAQLRAHAERVPYPQAATALRRLADIEDRHAQMLREQIAALGGSAPEVVPAISQGRNHWERIAADYQKADEKRRRYLEQAIHWDIDYPDVAALLSRIAAEETANRRLLEELVIRADSLALD